MTGSGDNVTIFANIVADHNAKNRYIHQALLYGFDRQLAKASSTIK